METNGELLNNNKKNVVETIVLIVTTFVFIVVFLLTNVFFAIVMVSGDSMCDTLSDGDVLIVSRTVNPDYGDVIVFDMADSKIIKRVIAKSGDTIYSDGTNVYLKKQGETEFTILQEPYVKNATAQFAEKVVEEGYYFVLGDNRVISNDSRYFGTINSDDVVGVVTEKVIEDKATYTKIFSWIFNL